MGFLDETHGAADSVVRNGSIGRWGEAYLREMGRSMEIGIGRVSSSLQIPGGGRKRKSTYPAG